MRSKVRLPRNCIFEIRLQVYDCDHQSLPVAVYINYRDYFTPHM